jgi:hypothetical protein
VFRHRIEEDDAMKRTLGLVLLVGLARAVEARADVAPPSLLARFAAYDAVVVGRVASVEPKTLTLRPEQGGPARAYHVVVIDVKRSIYGADGSKQVRLAITESPEAFTKHVGAEACFLLKAHPDAPVYVQPWEWDDVISRHQDEKVYTEKFLPWVDKLARLRREPDCYLVRGSREERFYTAVILLVRYRGFYGHPEGKTELVDLDRSRAVLRALLDADWTRGNEWDEIPPLLVFLNLGLTRADGWDPGGVITAEKAKTWLREHQETYRIRRAVPAGK